MYVRLFNVFSQPVGGLHLGDGQPPEVLLIGPAPSEVYILRTNRGREPEYQQTTAAVVPDPSVILPIGRVKR